MSDVSVTVLRNWNHGKEYDREAIAEDYKNDMSLSEVMRKHGIRSWSTIINIMDNMGVKRRSISEGVRLSCKKKRLRYLQKLKLRKL